MIHEECGLLGIYAAKQDQAVHDDMANLCYAGLYALQHRGQESAGIALNTNGHITNRRDVGLVSEVFNEDSLKNLGDKGAAEIAIAHVRYATTGAGRRSNAQPIVIKHIKGSMALGHNGNLTNAARLRRTLELSGNIFHSTSDTEVIMYTITHERLKVQSIERALSNAMNTLRGAYSIVMMSRRKLIAARDPNGFRPLCIGKIGESIVFASESCALNAIGAEFIRDVRPGEIVVVSDDGMESIADHCGAASSLCVFEYIYFARPDSVIDGVSVHKARLRAGEMLAEEHPARADVVIGVPDSGLDAALGFARASGIPYDFGFLKNKYIGRTFIAPNQQQRELSVRIKLNPIADAVKGKRVVIVDDSIVRGTTSMKIIRLLRAAGATEVHMRLSCPPFLYPCYFGTDVDTSENLIAYKHTLFEIRDIIGADSLGYLSKEALRNITEGCHCSLCDACFSGVYPVDISSAQIKSQFEQDIDAD
ncbi:MAG: amidophosphoribosyltransferase [Spirochaetaceae bacterium]|jgi:amidophosphoribosyltransferase|nr:amidophosphoribosyltransferase [Spirochaetaceae bacterium]